MGRRPRGPARTGSDPLSRLFHALSDPTRRQLLNALTVGSSKVTDLARPYRMSLPAVSKHLRILEEAGLVSRTVDGRVHRLSLTGEPLRQVETWLDPFRAYWAGTLEALKADLARHPPSSSGEGRTGGHGPRSGRRRSGPRRRGAGPPPASRASP